MLLKFLKKHKDKINQTGGIDAKKEAVQRTNDVAARVNELVDKMDMRYHDIPVEIDRRSAV
jgi:hypothetical protein